VLVYIDSTYSTEDIRIDYTALFITLAIVVLPACAGISLRNSARGNQQLGRYPLWQWCEKIGSAFGAAMLVAVFVYAFVTQADFIDQRADVWVPALLFQPIGCLVGYGLASLVKLDLPSRRAVSLETGVQNFSFVIAILALSFSDDCDRQRRALVFPYILSICWVLNSVWICGAMRYYADTVSASPPATDDSDKGDGARADSSEKDPTSPRPDQFEVLPVFSKVSVI
jgi:predicted Na+-dependent transporter